MYVELKVKNDAFTTCHILGLSNTKPQVRNHPLLPLHLIDFELTKIYLGRGW